MQAVDRTRHPPPWDTIWRIDLALGISLQLIRLYREFPSLYLAHAERAEAAGLRVHGSSMKTHNGKQLRLGLDALEAIARNWNPQRDLLFPFPFDKGVFYDQFHRIREAAGLSLSSCHLG
jgi:hypothetical protein